MAGSIPFSGQQQFDAQGRPLAGGKFYTFVSGTSTPLTVYQDSALTVPHANPLTLDASGRIPILYAPDGSLKFRIADAAGVTVFTADFVLVIGPSGGGGGGPGVDATTVFSTGDIKARYSSGTITGWVRCNKRTIGSATSGATERANADCQALFEFLWTADPNLPVSGGRGASANADWTANKTIETLDGRGRAFAGLDDMGNSAAGRLTSTYFGSSAIVLGNANGAESRTLITANMAAHTHTGSGTTAGHTHGYRDRYWAALAASVGAASFIEGVPGGNYNGNYGEATHDQDNTSFLYLDTNSSSATDTYSFTTSSTGSGSAFATVQPTILVTFFIKL